MLAPFVRDRLPRRQPQSQISDDWQAVVPPILLTSVICLGAQHRRPTWPVRWTRSAHAAAGSLSRDAPESGVTEPRPTCLALSWTFTQPPLSLTTLTGSYPAGSPLTADPVTKTKFAAGILSVAVVVTPRVRMHPRRTLALRQATLCRLLDDTESREVPLITDGLRATHPQPATEHLLALFLC